MRAQRAEEPVQANAKALGEGETRMKPAGILRNTYGQGSWVKSGLSDKQGRWGLGVMVTCFPLRWGRT